MQTSAALLVKIPDELHKKSFSRPSFVELEPTPGAATRKIAHSLSNDDCSMGGACVSIRQDALPREVRLRDLLEATGMLEIEKPTRLQGSSRHHPKGGDLWKSKSMRARPAGGEVTAAAAATGRERKSARENWASLKVLACG